MVTTKTTPRRNRLHDASNQPERGAHGWSSMGDTLAPIVTACQQGNREAQRQLYERCCDRVFRLVVRMVGNQEAPDVTQEVFLQVYRTITQFSRRSRFETWLYRLVINVCLQFLRGARRRSCVILEHDPVDPSPSLTRRVERRELLERALQRLDPELRGIFLLREFEELDYREIAQALEISEGTVASRLNRARTKLKQNLVGSGCEI